MSNKRSSKGFILGLTVALLLPLSFYMIVHLMAKDRIYLPKYYVPESVGTKTVNGKQVPDTNYHKVGELTLVNQLGETVSLNKDLPGKVMVVNFFYISCPTICPKLTGNIGLLQKAFKKNPKMESSFDTVVQFVSISVNPTADSVHALRAYGDAHGVNHDKWWFLTGDKKAIYNYARNELHLAVPGGDGGAEDFIHSQKLVLIDQQRYIRGYYDGLDTAEVKRCADDIVLLTLEKKKKK